MADESSRPQTLTSDPKALHKIKYIQFRRQMIPLAVVILLMIVNVIFPIRWLLYPTLAAFAWYLLERVLYRTKNKIAVPEESAFVSPVDGKVQSVRRGEDATLLTIRKTWIDVVELRLPYPGLQMEKTSLWKFDTPQGQVEVRIQNEKISYFDDLTVHGSVIGMIPSNAIFTIHIPAGIKVLVQDKQNLFGGETELFSLAENADVDETSKSILVEEPLDDLQ
jgi:hypothetical protein